MSKQIVFCADGTWNNPNEDENHDQTSDPTNVYKLFVGLDGALSDASLLLADEQEKELQQDGATIQIAKYLHGVGDSRNPIIKLMGGAFGAGIISRIVRGYTFISRNYAPGDAITILGFSRGAYTARALAGLIASQGLLNPALTADHEKAYRCGAEAWYRYRRAALRNPFSLACLGEIIADLPAFLSQGSLKDADLVPVPTLAAVGVWDTVGAMGIPDYDAGQRQDAFRFADTKLSDKVLNGFHAVALDERRDDFVPTLWDPADRIRQVLFPGAHADVGGGYPSANGESGLSDGALKWMAQQLGQVGLTFRPGWLDGIQPNATATAHQPWAALPWCLPGVRLGPRTFPSGLSLDASIQERQSASAVLCEPDRTPAPYRPTNLPA
ncbi:hypothetical protein GETHLI_17980 [Geothrix limicola]|uniref:T6SS Phospholipase effector Tle1-like catalytic domain-containing protein n=1 Tax=Geothrix limicola TaxID=2927978 RepID=A0ABQ5QFT7_9BACT|nr:DUF2235 domain-containing protein [Geothrix limicola]GLH73296.1 hypothetical protein GETHLI_17980 [Geothrix limicola]